MAIVFDVPGGLVFGLDTSCPFPEAEWVVSRAIRDEIKQPSQKAPFTFVLKIKRERARMPGVRDFSL